jgi:hypothetical protein
MRSNRNAKLNEFAIEAVMKRSGTHYSARRRLALLLKIVGATAAIILMGALSAAQAQQSFATMEEAVAALVSAAKAGDRNAIVKILGRGGTDIASSGDPVADADTRERFVAAFDAKHQVMMDSADKGILVIGANEFPFPIPLVRKGGRWQFDTASGRLEILYRRIGRNELDAVQASLAYVDAQNEYAEKDRTGEGAGTYAQRIVSQSGKKDGLYWPAGGADDSSPLGELVAKASSDGYRVGGGRAPFHGYYYKILTQQGSTAPGGAANYVVRGKMIGGFALVAYPAEYGNSGVMTFLVNHNGVVFEKDLGPHTARVAGQMTSFNPDQTWKKVAVTIPLR